jgi:RNB domain
MIERGLEPEFSRAALQELKAIAHAGQDTDPRVVDMTAWLWCSIDNDDSRDLDQLTVAEKQADGQTKVWVAVADVDVLVPKSSALDAHAKHNTTSVYTSTRVFPMLPDRLCTDLTSLNPHQERLAVVVEMCINATASSTAPKCTTKPSWPTTRFLIGLKATKLCLIRRKRCTAWLSSCCCKTQWLRVCVHVGMPTAPWSLKPCNPMRCLKVSGWWRFVSKCKTAPVS